jgi:PIN domain nuclease of toxin-antitoxin system
MNLLLDTHVLLWWLADDRRLSNATKTAIKDTDNVITVSAVTIFEIAIKKGLGKLEIVDDWYEAIEEESFRRLAVTWEHARKIPDLPDLHRDPFDRLLIAQAAVEGLTLVTHDDLIMRYKVPCLRA